MYIEILKTFEDLGTVYQAGQKIHVPAALGERAVFAKVAQKVKYGSYVERLRAEDAERQRAQNPVSAEVTWAVCVGAIRGHYYVSAKCSAPQCTALTYDGAPTENLEFQHSCGCGVRGPEKVPAAIVEQYRKLKKSQPVRQLGKDEAVAAVLGRPQPSLPVDLSKVLPANPTQPGCEKEHLLNYLPNPTDGKHVDKKIFGPQNGGSLIPGDEITRPLPFKI